MPSIHDQSWYGQAGGWTHTYLLLFILAWSGDRAIVFAAIHPRPTKLWGLQIGTYVWMSRYLKKLPAQGAPRTDIQKFRTSLISSLASWYDLHRVHDGLLEPGVPRTRTPIIEGGDNFTSTTRNGNGDQGGRCRAKTLSAEWRRTNNRESFSNFDERSRINWWQNIWLSLYATDCEPSSGFPPPNKAPGKQQ